MLQNVIRDIDIEDLDRNLNNYIDKRFDIPVTEDIDKYVAMIKDLYKFPGVSLDIMKKKHKCLKRNSYAYQIFKMVPEIFEDYDETFIRERLKVKPCKSQSGVISITVFTSGYPEFNHKDKVIANKFSCKWDCAYCPNEPGQPRSYLKGEPGVMRANRNDFNCISQMHDRMITLYNNGHDIDKLEVLVLGGTWTSYPIQYREEFIRDIYYSANVFNCKLKSKNLRKANSLFVERNSNKDSLCRIIGLTLETRPDTIVPDEIKLLRYYGCTRVQIGIQHVSDDILQKVNRGCNSQDAINAIKLLKDCGFKIDAHWMPNLPGSSPDIDDDMFASKLLGVKSKHYYNNYEVWDMKCPQWQVDQWKIYPCTVVPFTKIEKWYKNGTYVPYNWELLTNILLKTKALMLPWIRLNRIVRDIPNNYSLNPVYNSNLRQSLPKILHNDGFKCRCIRCREVKSGDLNRDFKIMIREYNASDGVEYFIEASHNDVLYGFIRLRLTEKQATHIFPEIKNCALIRELHVYGNVAVDKSKNVQHRGIGKLLIYNAEKISKEKRFEKIVVIAGEGVRNYYAKNGFSNLYGVGRYMIKNIK